jgi:hypothetical protein
VNDKIVGAILLAVAGLVVAIGAVGSQIADAIVLGQFFGAKIGGTAPTGPENAGLHIGVIVAALVLALTGLIFLLRKSR